LDEKLAKAWSAFPKYRLTSIAERAAMMRRAAEILDNEKETFGRLMTAENGENIARCDRRGGEMRVGVQILCRECRMLAR
jgi:succinate-semialdehyde dehydrogenase/glutarate-semialdehyde dehydrogenase